MCVAVQYKPMKIAWATLRIIHFLSMHPWVGESFVSALGVCLSVYVYKCPLLMVHHLTGGTPTCSGLHKVGYPGLESGEAAP